ncbi:NAD(P)/FAD-dependent oxidoreductase [Paenibacillus sp. XY044]|uniref:NAD(P)/FAD-dependent oxidoreductase n=1 Tax=Paenibacillus sp. XY044 TaxID=2026089 RepID=UPI000B97EB71|nr:NAD(P)/FAD-dependent oxidoreductase [Paenibacillus sp. XY044]OZB98669.1 pyridine nucleotide-disulfide oxidoreductase [Paenibacillus sp. XY044]
MSEALLDAVIIGGGPAGMSAALALGRSRRSAIVIDEGLPRNRVTHEMHNFLSRDGIAPAEFRRIAREQIGNYPAIKFVQGKAESVEGNDGDFRVHVSDGKVFRSKKLLFATGKRDLPIDISGLYEVYGKSAFVCPYCDGWELQDQQLVMIAAGEAAMHLSKVLMGWSTNLTLCTNGPDEMKAEQRQELERHGIIVKDSPIQAIESEEGVVKQILLENGESVACTGIFFAPKLAAATDLPQSLGCEVSETGSVTADRIGKTNVPGVFSAGDAASEMYQAVAAASMGALAGMGINSELLDEAWKSV